MKKHIPSIKKRKSKRKIEHKTSSLTKNCARILFYSCRPRIQPFVEIVKVLYEMDDGYKDKRNLDLLCVRTNYPSHVRISFKLTGLSPPHHPSIHGSYSLFYFVDTYNQIELQSKADFE